MLRDVFAKNQNERECSQLEQNITPRTIISKITRQMLTLYKYGLYCVHEIAFHLVHEHYANLNFYLLITQSLQLFACLIRCRFN